MTLGILTLILAMASSPAPMPFPARPLTTRESMWNGLEPKPEVVFQLDKMVNVYRNTKSRYEKVRDMKKPGCPPAVIFVLHMRESGASFSKHLHEGSSLTARTRYIPKGRPVAGSPPFKWEDSAYDALYVIKSYDRPEKWAKVDSMVDWIERYNGLGYRNKGIRSPYCVARSNKQEAGKYVADGKFSRTTWDQQLGCLTLLKALEDAGLFTPPPY
jgi:lysozyme family protein